ncbi:MAG: hypothetical protein ACP5IT_12295 [Thermoproteota archaeon]
MVFWTCYVFKVNPKIDNFVKDIIASKGEYAYDKIDEKTLYFYIDNIQTMQHGKIIKVGVDKPFQVSNREEGKVLVKETVSLTVCFYDEINGISNILAVFGSGENVSSFKYAMRMIVSERVKESKQFPNLVVVPPILPIGFRLKGKEKELSKYFSNIRELSAKNIKDLYVHRASIGGSFLEQSSEYQKYVRASDVSGDISYLGVTFKDRVIMLSSEGKIWTRQGKEEVEFSTVEEILKILQTCGATFTS